MSTSDKSNKVERIWHDPPMIDDPPEKPFTLGAGATPEIRSAFNALGRSYKKSRLISIIATASAFTIAYAAMTLVPDVTTEDILTVFIATTVITIIIEVKRYYRQL